MVYPGWTEPAVSAWSRSECERDVILSVAGLSTIQKDGKHLRRFDLNSIDYMTNV